MIRLRSFYLFPALLWALGLTMGEIFPWSDYFLWSFLILFSLNLFLRHTFASFWVIMIAFTLVAGSLSALRKERGTLLGESLDPRTRTYSGTLRSSSEMREISQRLLVELLPDSVVHHSDIGVYLYFSLRDSLRTWQYGDTIVFISSLESPQQIDDFDYRDFLRRKGIYYTGFVRSGNWKLFPAERSNFHALLSQWRTRCVHALTQWKLSETEHNILLAVLLGIRKDIPEDIKDNFARIGVIHVMAVSGLHLGIWFLGIRFLLNWMPSTWKKWRTLVVIPIIWTVALIAGASPSAMRAATMFSMISLQEWFGKGRNALDTVMLSMILLTSLNTDLFFQLGFQLSYLAVIGIITIYPWLDKAWDTSFKPLKFIKSMGGVSISAQIMTTPLALYHFRRFPTLFLPANILVVPQITLLVYLGFIGLVFQLFDVFPGPIVFVIKLLLRSILWITSELSS